ncbi:MAG: iron chaperone [bacterium]
MKAKQKPAQHAAAKFTKEELGAMRSRVKELKVAATKAEEEKAVVAAIAELQAADRALAKRIHAIIKASVPALAPKPWYGMPAYAKDGKIVCFFQPAQKFKTRYATLGFSDEAKLDEGNLWPNAYALTQLTPADEARIAALVKKAAT